MKLHALALAITASSLPLVSLAQVSSAEDSKKSLQAQAERAGVIFERGRQAHYTKKFDLSGLPDYARVRRFILASAPFSPRDRTLTTNGRIRRDAVHELYAAAIDACYRDALQSTA